MNKAANVLTFIEAAMTFYRCSRHTDESAEACQKRVRDEAKMQKVSKYVQKVRKMGKREYRAEKSTKKEEDFKKQTGRYLPEEDILSFRKTAIEELSGIIL